MIVTEYVNICALCGRPTEAKHHLIFGTSARKLADEDGLVLPLCNNCHNMGKLEERIHGNAAAEKLSKMLGQAIYEGHIGDREAFRKRYGKSYL